MQWYSGSKVKFPGLSRKIREGWQVCNIYIYIYSVIVSMGVIITGHRVLHTYNHDIVYRASIVIIIIILPSVNSRFSSELNIQYWITRSYIISIIILLHIKLTPTIIIMRLWSIPQRLQHSPGSTTSNVGSSQENIFWHWS